MGIDIFFWQDAIIAGFFLAICSGIIGSLITINRMSYIAGGIAHTIYGGVGISVFFGFSILLGSLAFGIAMGLFIAYKLKNDKSKLDSILGLIWAGGMALGILLIESTPGFSEDFLTYLFGNILLVSISNLYQFVIFDIVAITFVVIFYRSIISFCYDADFAISNLNMPYILYFLMVLISIGIVLGMQISGLILVIAMFSIPSSIAEMFANSVCKIMILSSVLSLIFIYLGLYIAILWDLSTGPIIILISIVFYAISSILKNKNFI